MRKEFTCIVAFCNFGFRFLHSLNNCCNEIVCIKACYYKINYEMADISGLCVMLLCRRRHWTPTKIVTTNEHHGGHRF